MKVLVLGARGNLGQDLVQSFDSAGHEAVGLGRTELDVTDVDVLTREVSLGGYDVVVNAVAWNDVDGAEDSAKRELVWELNASVPGRLARLAREAGAAFVHYSSDFVFAGDHVGGYVESDRPNPISAYGESKLAGEIAVQTVGGRSFVCRTSKLFGCPGTSASTKPSFVSLMLKLAAEKPELKIIDDEVGSPTYTADVAEATVRLLSDGYDPGTYHLVNEGPGVGWYGFAQEFFGLLGVRTPREPVSSDAFPRPARRPSQAKLNNTKFPPLRYRREALRAFFANHPEVMPERFREIIHS